MGTSAIAEPGGVRVALQLGLAGAGRLGAVDEGVVGAAEIEVGNRHEAVLHLVGHAHVGDEGELQVGLGSLVNFTPARRVSARSGASESTRCEAPSPRWSSKK